MTDASIVIPTHERVAFLREAVRSALAQGADQEVIVVRSNGESAARDLSREFPRITMLECDGKQAAARNAGCSIATGDWVLFLDDDDLLLPGALDRLLAVATTHRADAVRGARIDFEDGDATPTSAADGSSVGRFLPREDLITGAEILTPSQTLFRRAALPEGPFREEFVLAEDYELGATMAIRGARVFATAASTTGYRHHPAQGVGSVHSTRALERRRAVLEEIDRHLARERRLRHRARGYHELYSRVPAELSNGRRRGALAAVLSAAAWSPALLRDSMWWRAAAHVALLGGTRS